MKSWPEEGSALLWTDSDLDSHASVKNITIWFDNRLLVTLDKEPPERIYVSKNRAAEFKAWIVRKNNL